MTIPVERVSAARLAIEAVASVAVAAAGPVALAAPAIHPAQAGRAARAGRAAPVLYGNGWPVPTSPYRSGSCFR